MKVSLKPHNDETSWFIRNAYYGGALKRADQTQPCSLCRMNALKAKPTKVRGHIHGSEFNICQLCLYQAMVNGVSTSVKGLENDASLYDGHVHEATIFEHLEKGGLDVSACANKPEFEKITDVACEIEDQETGRIEVVQFKIISHIDGVLVFKGKNYGLEIKAVKKYTWDKIKRTSEISDQWYGQIQWYTKAMGMPFYLIVKNRATSDIMSPILILPNENFIQERLLRLRDTIRAIRRKNPLGLIHKEETRSSSSQCKFCRFYDSCWTGSSRPKFTQEEEEEIEFKKEMEETPKVTLDEFSPAEN
jgi:hypothetical protein